MVKDILLPSGLKQSNWYNGDDAVQGNIGDDPPNKKSNHYYQQHNYCKNNKHNNIPLNEEAAVLICLTGLSCDIRFNCYSYFFRHSC